eukprot:6881915-Pyramimonas_sp.AAC.1
MGQRSWLPGASTRRGRRGGRPRGAIASAKKSWHALGKATSKSKKTIAASSRMRKLRSIASC